MKLRLTELDLELFEYENKCLRLETGQYKLGWEKVQWLVSAHRSYGKVKLFSGANFPRGMRIMCKNRWNNLKRRLNRALPTCKYIY